MIFGTPSIVTNGLVLHLDAGSRMSYTPPNSVAWRDLSGNGLNGNITVSGSGAVSASFNSGNQGSIQFSGTGSYVNFGNPNNTRLVSGSLNVWFRCVQGQTTVSNAGYNAIVAKVSAYGLLVSGSNLVTYDWGNGVGRDTNVNVANNTWYNACMTFTTITGNPSNNAIIYLNGSPILTTTIKQLNQSTNFFIGYGNVADQFLVGNVSQTQLYNRVLSPQEITQNYNALKNRFGLS